jgi:hypothetical protein
MKAIKVGLVLLLMLVMAEIPIAMTTTATTNTTFKQIELTDPRSLRIEQTGLVEEYYLFEGGKWIKELRPIAWWMHVKLDGVKIYNIKARMLKN